MSLKTIFTLDERELILYLQGCLGHGVTDKENYLYLQNKKSPLLLQAHIDSYAKYGKKFEIYLDEGILSANGILGADDRAGVFGIWSIAKRCAEKKIDIPNMLFTGGEESGGKGMKKFLQAVKDESFSHIKLGIALDRRNANEYVTYVDIENEVKKYIEKWGFISGHGSYSDIKDWSEKTKIPSVNLSVGYYDNHFQTETLHLDELTMTINRVMKIVQNPIPKLYPCKAKYTYVYNRGVLEDQDYSEGWVHGNNCCCLTCRKDEKEKDKKKKKGSSVCEICNMPILKDDCLVSTWSDGYQFMACGSCRAWLSMIAK
jgi:hypothetical protein